MDVTWSWIAARDLQRSPRELLKVPDQFQNAGGHTRRDIPHSAHSAVAENEKRRHEVQDMEEVTALRSVPMDNQR